MAAMSPWSEERPCARLTSWGWRRVGRGGVECSSPSFAALDFAKPSWKLWILFLKGKGALLDFYSVYSWTFLSCLFLNFIKLITFWFLSFFCVSLIFSPCPQLRLSSRSQIPWALSAWSGRYFCHCKIAGHADRWGGVQLSTLQKSWNSW